MLPSSHIADVEKSIRYAHESDRRIVFTRFDASLEGDHRDHAISYDHGTWTCDCEGHEQNGTCSHTMTLERVLRDMVQMELVGERVPALTGA